MSKVDGYQIIGKLTETELFEVFKASGVDGRYYTVFATTENHGPEQCGKSHHAFKVAHSCTSPHVLKVHSIKEFPDQSIMIGEPVEAECLHDFIRNDNHSGVETLFFLAFGLIDAIEYRPSQATTLQYIFRQMPEEDHEHVQNFCLPLLSYRLH